MTVAKAYRFADGDKSVTFYTILNREGMLDEEFHTAGIGGLYVGTIGRPSFVSLTAPRKVHLIKVGNSLSKEIAQPQRG